VLLLGALLLWAVWPRTQDLSPFEEAVAALATTPGATMQNASLDGTVVAQTRVAATGESTGRLSIDGVTFDLMSVGGQSYLRSENGVLPGGPIGVASADGSAELEASLLADRWVAVDLAALNSSWQQPPSPTRLAVRLQAALADRDKVQLVDEPGPEISGEATRVAQTSAGAVYVTTAAPHRVVRIDPTSGVQKYTGERAPGNGGAGGELGPAGLRRASAVDAVTESEPPREEGESVPWDEMPARPDSLDGGPIDLEALDAVDVQELFEELAEQTEKLAEAADASLELVFQGQPTISCGPSGCSWSGMVVARLRSTGDVRSLQASVSLNVTVSVQGTPAGPCTQQTALVLEQPAPVSCSVPQAGPVFVAANERAKSIALASTPPGGTARWLVSFSGVGVVIARVDVAVDELRAGLEDSREESLCLARPDKDCGTGRLPWTSWQNYPKTTVDGREYAQIGDRLYSRHAVDRLQPRGLGAPAGASGPGRSISPNFVEDVLSSTRGVPVKGPNGEPRLSFVSGSVQVITENNIVVTVITR
jgi:hypothetical protein